MAVRITPVHGEEVPENEPYLSDRISYLLPQLKALTIADKESFCDTRVT
jgi:hypothetical protein